MSMKRTKHRRIFMKKNISILLAIILLSLSLVSCGGEGDFYSNLEVTNFYFSTDNVTYTQIADDYTTNETDFYIRIESKWNTGIQYSKWNDYIKEFIFHKAKSVTTFYTIDIPEGTSIACLEDNDLQTKIDNTTQKKYYFAFLGEEGATETYTFHFTDYQPNSEIYIKVWYDDGHRGIEALDINCDTIKVFIK